MTPAVERKPAGPARPADVIPDAAYAEIAAVLIREAERLDTPQSESPGAHRPGFATSKGATADESYPDKQTRAS